MSKVYKVWDGKFLSNMWNGRVMVESGSTFSVQIVSWKLICFQIEDQNFWVPTLIATLVFYFVNKVLN